MQEILEEVSLRRFNELKNKERTQEEEIELQHHIERRHENQKRDERFNIILGLIIAFILLYVLTL